MVEFLVALGIFSTVVVSVLATQLSGKRMQYEALERSEAAALATNMLAIVQANSGRSMDYVVEELGDPNAPQEAPTVDCRRVACTARELAVFDLWRFEQSLLGANVRNGTEYAGGLDAPRVCVREQAGILRVAIVWRALLPAPQPVGMPCGAELHLYDAPEQPEGNGLLRRQLVLVSHLAGGH